MIRLSLIIATYNRAEPLLTALRSVAAQDADPTTWECVVVNNNSRDDTATRFEAFSAVYPALNLRMVTETRQGLSHARNRGIAETQGEYIAIIDDDERINPGFISAYIAFFDTHPQAASAGGRIIPEYPAGRPAWLSKYTEIPIANPIDLGTLIHPFPVGCIPGGGNMALRRSTVERYGAFNPTLGRTGTKLIGGEESDLFARLASAGESCWYVPDAIMWHIIPPEKLTTEYFDRLCFNIGVTQRARAGAHARHLFVREMAKWCVTLFIATLFFASFRPAKGAWLVRMRRGITKGIFRTKANF